MAPCLMVRIPAILAGSELGQAGQSPSRPLAASRRRAIPGPQMRGEWPISGDDKTALSLFSGAVSVLSWIAGVLCGRLADECRQSRKEVIQPHLPIRLPCYDFTPVIDHTVASAPLAVKLPASGATNSHGVTGGVYKARERIHRGNADPRLLAIPTSRSRVADSDPD